MHTKTVTVDINWLDKIDGCTVSDAIAYLSKLNQNHVLSYYMEGDTHGCKIISDMSYEMLKTNTEIYSGLSKHYLKEIVLYENARQKHIKDGNVSHIENCTRLIDQLNNKLAEAKLKYNQN